MLYHAGALVTRALFATALLLLPLIYRHDPGAA
jgi:hypothetical protein